MILSKEHKDKLEMKMDQINLQKQRNPTEVIPKWVDNARTKGTGGLGYIHKKNSFSKKKYVELACVKV